MRHRQQQVVAELEESDGMRRKARAEDGRASGMNIILHCHRSPSSRVVLCEQKMLKVTTQAHMAKHKCTQQNMYA